MPPDVSTSFGHFQNAEQIAFWNGAGGQQWVARQAAQDRILAPMLDLLLARADIQTGESIVDIGCGCGAATFAATEKVGPTEQVIGLDVSEPMLARARELAPQGAPVTFVRGDAMVHHFKAASANLILSRLGVMYFSDPVRAFLNIRNALRSGGRVAFACWRELRDNPWFLEPLQAVYDHVPRLPALLPHAPDPFAFASSEWVEHVLGEAGLRRVRLEPCEVKLDVSGGEGLEGAVQTALAIGPASRALDGQSAEAIAAATPSVRKTLSRYAKRDGTVMMPASFWIVTAVDP